MILHAVQVEQPITSIVVVRNNIMTAHVGNVMKVWNHDADRLQFDCNTRLNNAPMMESESETQQGIWNLQQVVDLERLGQDSKPEHSCLGQVAHLQSTPDYASVVL